MAKPKGPLYWIIVDLKNRKTGEMIEVDFDIYQKVLTADEARMCLQNLETNETMQNIRVYRYDGPKLVGSPIKEFHS